MKKTIWMAGVLCGCLAASCGSVQDVQAHGSGAKGAPTAYDDEDDGEDGDEEEDIALDQVPQSVKDAAAAAVPGLVLTGAEKETEEGELHYCLEGTADGEAVEVEVTPDGKVVEVERGEDEDD